MSAEMDSGTRVVDIWVRLLDDGTEVTQPTKAVELGNGTYRILPTPDYDPSDETWEFPPGSTVGCETRKDEKGTFQVACARRKG
jgi:hypothetical protein